MAAEGPVDDPAPPIPNPPAPVPEPPIILTASLPNASLGVAYSESIAVENGLIPYTFSITAGALPGGLALNAGTGTISGTPTATGSFTFILQVEDSAEYTALATFTIVVPSVPSIQNATLPNGAVGIPYAASLSGQGGAQPYGFQVLSGGLPDGLVLATTGGITGLPTTAGVFTVTIQVYDSNDPQGTGSATFSITIAAANITNPVTTLEEMVLMGCADGGLYAIIPGQRYDTDINGNPVGYLQQWNGVPGNTTGLAVLQCGGASLSAKGNGPINVIAIDDDGNAIPLTTATRTMVLSETETKRDLGLFPAPQSERFGMGFNNGGVAGNWFELHTAILWVRKFFSGRKA